MNNQNKKLTLCLEQHHKDDTENCYLEKSHAFLTSTLEGYF